MTDKCRIIKRNDMSNEQYIKELKENSIYQNIVQPKSNCPCNTCRKHTIARYTSYKQYITGLNASARIRWNNIYVNKCTDQCIKCIYRPINLPEKCP